MSQGRISGDNLNLSAADYIRRDQRYRDNLKVAFTSYLNISVWNNNTLDSYYVMLYEEELIMPYKLSIFKKSDYLHAIVTGQNSFENVKRYLKQIFHECKTADCCRLLIEERLEGPRLKTINVFDIASKESQRAIGVLRAIAFVDINSEGDLMGFAETVAFNRGLPVRTFSTVGEAERWLMDQNK